MKRFSLLLFLVLFTTADLFAQRTAEVILAGYNNVPVVHTPATGVVTVTLRSDTLFVEGKFEDLRSNYRSSSIHYGPRGESGNRMLALKAELGEEHRSGVFNREDNYHVLRPSVLEALRRGNLYISIATQRHQRGEIRGQIPAMN